MTHLGTLGQGQDPNILVASPPLDFQPQHGPGQHPCGRKSPPPLIKTGALVSPWGGGGKNNAHFHSNPLLHTGWN